MGPFLDESDENNFTGIGRPYLRVRVSIDIQTPVKRRTLIKRPGGDRI